MELPNVDRIAEEHGLSPDEKVLLQRAVLESLRIDVTEGMIGMIEQSEPWEWTPPYDIELPRQDLGKAETKYAELEGALVAQPEVGKAFLKWLEQTKAYYEQIQAQSQ
ncbi:MAG: hypothetical protein HW405_925 [Candidatus Berkelbacteria bacterium]|nr:hypothetical protein [Candidatus Berkelbacteria bacterium]